MPPIYVKGGVWTNIEDEILKAAVSKYGVNQWSRVASLLTKKNSKQAKARWNEWLNPLINKTSWLREEDEKLLNLVKLLPNQWRTIAPIMGRTATQCVERYQQLLEDEAEDDTKVDKHQDDDDLKLRGPGIEAIPASQVAVGDLNLNPESKPAKPDDDELSDDDKEMLYEAKARLANTKGKKAKRRERERMLEETKRLSLVQKRRELKASGIKVHLTRKKNSKEFDYNGDIPFEHTPSTGLYDVEGENEANMKDTQDFESVVSSKGLDLNRKREDSISKKSQPTGSTQNKRHSSVIQGNEEIYESRKKVKPILPDVEETHETYKDNDFSGVFHKEENIEDIDTRILNVMKEIKQSNSRTSTLLGDDIVVNETNTKNINKAIRNIIRNQFMNLPKPKNEFQVLPKFDDYEEEIKLVKQSHIKPQEIKKLELLRQIDEQKAKSRRSLVVQRGLDIPDPRLLKLIDESQYSELDARLIRQFQRLIKSDFKKYVDSNYVCEEEEDLDEDTYDKVHQEISKVLQPKIESVNIDVKLDYSREEIIQAIESLKSDCRQLQNELNQRFPQSTPDISSLWQELNDEKLRYKTFEHIMATEDKAMANRRQRLDLNVDYVAAKEQELMDYITSNNV